MHKPKRAWRTFFTAFILALCVFGLGCAFLLIEYNIQKTTYGQVDFGITYTMQDGAPQVHIDDRELPAISPSIARLSEAAVPPPLRLFAAVWQWEVEVVQWVLTWLR